MSDKEALKHWRELEKVERLAVIWRLKEERSKYDPSSRAFRRAFTRAIAILSDWKKDRPKRRKVNV